jgi:hypothetical protein
MVVEVVEPSFLRRRRAQIGLHDKLSAWLLQGKAGRQIGWTWGPGEAVAAIIDRVRSW